MYQEKSSLMSKQIRTEKKVVVYQQNEIDQGAKKTEGKKDAKSVGSGKYHRAHTTGEDYYFFSQKKSEYTTNAIKKKKKL